MDSDNMGRGTGKGKGGRDCFARKNRDGKDDNMHPEYLSQPCAPLTTGG